MSSSRSPHLAGDRRPALEPIPRCLWSSRRLEEFGGALLASFAGALVCTGFYLVVHWVALPATDEAKQSGALGLLLMFLNPFVYLVALPVLVAGALLAFVLWFALLRSRDLERSVKFVVACVLVAVLACAPLSHGVALSAALAALALGALAARYVPWCERHA